MKTWRYGLRIRTETRKRQRHQNGNKQLRWWTIMSWPENVPKIYSRQSVNFQTWMWVPFKNGQSKASTVVVHTDIYRAIITMTILAMSRWVRGCMRKSSHACVRAFRACSSCWDIVFLSFMQVFADIPPNAGIRSSRTHIQQKEHIFDLSVSTTIFLPWSNFSISFFKKETFLVVLRL